MNSISRQVFHKTEVVAENGVVTAMHPLAAEAGIEILQSGGNAIDGAVATALAIGVVEPFLSGIGGASYAVVYEASTERVRAFDGSVTVPTAAREDMFELAPDGGAGQGLYGWPATKDGESETGFRSIAIPGALASLSLLHHSCGRLPWKELVAPAIRLAREGFPADWSFFFHSAASLVRLHAMEETRRAFFLPNGTAYCPSYPVDPAGEVQIRLPELGTTLETIQRGGVRDFYHGSIAAAVSEHLRANGGLLSVDDLGKYEARELPPLETSYRGERLFHLPTHSGGPTVALILNVLEALGHNKYSRGSADWLHCLAEAMRIGYSDRFRWMGDPAFDPIPYDGLVSKDYARDRARRVLPTGKRLVELPEGNPGAFGSSGPELGADARLGSGDAPNQHTTHLNVVDKDRNMVALTQTLGARFGSGVTVPGLGFPLNNGMMWFDPVPGRLASIAPGKRALHAAAPTIWMSERGPRFAVGTPGARKIKGAVAQVLVRAIDERLGPQAAIEAPRIHCDTGPLLCDERFDLAAREALVQRGHRVFAKSEDSFSSIFARPTAVSIDEKGLLHGGVEPYKLGFAMGY